MSVCNDQVRYQVEQEETNSPPIPMSPSNHVLFCLLYKLLTNKKKLTLFMFQKQNAL